MSGLSERLNRMKQHAPNLLQARTGDNRLQSEHDGWSEIQAKQMACDGGQFVIRERRYTLAHRHGSMQLGRFIEEPGEFTGFDRKPMEPVQPDKMVFLDTETTGLGIGAGNVPFMIGLGYYSGEEFIVQQMFIRNPSEERAMLHFLKEKLSAFSHVVTYNGRTFDWPVVKNRFILNRIPFTDDGLVQVDLLYPSRSLWKESLPSCRLGIVEEVRLGFFREEDVPGSLAPTLYFQFLNSGDVKTVEGVFIHNEFDILSLAGLAVHLSDLLAGLVSLEKMPCEELYRLGLWYDKLRKPELMEKAWQVLLSRPYQEKVAYLNSIASLYKKKKDMREAVKLWEQIVKTGSGKGGLAIHSLAPMIELAMYFEHQMRDYNQALFYTEKALQIAIRRLSLGRGGLKQRVEVEALQKRLQRLKRKSAAGLAQQELPVLF